MPKLLFILLKKMVGLKKNFNFSPPNDTRPYGKFHFFTYKVL